MQTYYGTKVIQAEPQDKPVPNSTPQEYEEGNPGYKVVYPDGYVSWSPKDVFEEAYHPLNSMSFGHAILALKNGHKVARSGWNGKNMYLELQVPDAHSKMTLPYIYMKTVQDDLVPWLASQTDMLADDWSIVFGR